MKYNTVLSTVGSYENQLDMFCKKNNFHFSGLDANEFTCGSKVIWCSISVNKDCTFPNGHAIRDETGHVKTERTVLLSNLKVFAASVSIDSAREMLCLELLQFIHAV